MPKFSERLRLLRTQSHLSQKELADRLGCISKSSINMYERGEREPNFETLEAIADFFNVDMDYLLGTTDIPNYIRATMSFVVESTSSGRTAAKDEMHRLFGAEHSAADLRVCGDKVAVLFYKALERHSASSLLDMICAVENLPPLELENIGAVVRAYLKAEPPIKEIVDTALKPYKKELFLDAEIG